jgi:hypothetical protein
MGREAACRARLDGKSVPGKALLETSELIFRSTVRGQLRVAVPFKEMTAVSASASDLTVVWGGGRLVLHLPAAAEAKAWAERIRNPPSRLEKLGVKSTSRVALVGGAATTPELRAFIDEVKARGATVLKSPPPATAGAEVIVFLTAETPADLQQIARLTPALRAGGTLWLLRSKGASAAVTEAEVRKAGRAAGLVDVKVAAFSATITADKFVVPLAARAVAAAPARPKARRA